MKEDFSEVYELFQDDVMEEVKGAAPGKRASLAHAAEDVDDQTSARKASIIEKTKLFAEALESLDSDSVDAMKEDFSKVYELFQDDVMEEVKGAAPGKRASLAHAAEDVDDQTSARKASIIEKTK